MRRSTSLVLVTVLAAGVTMAAGAPAGAAPAAGHPRAPHSPQPPKVTGLSAYQDAARVTLGWHDPGHAYSSLVVRYAAGITPPATPRDGTAVRVAPSATAATLPALTANHRYAATVWTRTGRRLSKAATTRFVTDEPAGHRLGRLTGVVTDRTGHPLSGVVVDAVAEGTGLGHDTVTGTDGRWTMRVPTDFYDILLDGTNGAGGDSDATGYVPVERFADVVAGPAVHEDAALRGGAAVSGHVTDTDGNPIEGVTVTNKPVATYVRAQGGGGGFGGVFVLISYAGLGVPASTRTDASGDYTLKGIDAAAFRTCFNASGPDVSGPVGGYVNTCSDARALKAGSTADGGTTTLTARGGGAIEGSVLAADGTPLGGAEVSAQSGGRPFSFADTVTDSSGRYRFADLHAGTYHLCVDTGSVAVTPGDPGYEGRCTQVTVVADATTRADVHARVGAALAGVVRSRTGHAVTSAYIELQRVGARRFAPGSYGYAITDAHGHWSAAGLAPGRYRVCVDPEDSVTPGVPTGVLHGCYHDRGAARAVRGKQRIGVDTSLAAAAAIAGRITDSAGHPVSDAFILTSRPSGRGAGSIGFTGPGGHYLVASLGGGRHLLCVQDQFPDGASVSKCPRTNVATTRPRGIPTRLGHVTRGVDRTLPELGSVSVTASDGSGQPVAGADTTLVRRCAHCQRQPLLGARGRIVATSVTTARGGVRLAGIRAGTYAVCLFDAYATTTGTPPATGYADTCAADDVTVTAGATTAATVEVPDGGAVTGTVTDSAGNGLAGVVVTVAGSPQTDVASDPFGFGSGPAAVRTGPDGSYTVRGVQPGQRTVCFDAAHASGGLGDAEGYASQCIGGAPGKRPGTGVDVTADATTGGTDIALTADGSITGSITGPGGSHLARRLAVVVVWNSAGGRFLDAVQPGPKGNYTLRRLLPGTYDVCFLGKRYAGQCWQGHPWNGRPHPTKGSDPVTVTSGAQTPGISAELKPRG